MSARGRIDVGADLAARLRRSAAATSVADAQSWVAGRRRWSIADWRLPIERLIRRWLIQRSPVNEAP
jgi:hypothetical protein